MQKTFALLKSITNLLKCMGRCYIEGNVCKWCHFFNGGRTDVHKEAQSGRSSVITEDLKDRVDVHVRENRQFTIDELCFMIWPLQDCRSTTLIQKKKMTTDEEVKETVTDWLNGLVGD
jgi:hypothetical protein